MSPSSVPWSFNTSSPSFQIQAISVSTTSGSVYYNVTPSSSNGWLLVNANGFDSASQISNIPINTQFAVKIGSQANALPAGLYTGSVTTH